MARHRTQSAQPGHRHLQNGLRLPAPHQATEGALHTGPEDPAGRGHVAGGLRGRTPGRGRDAHHPHGGGPAACDARRVHRRQDAGKERKPPP